MDRRRLAFIVVGVLMVLVGLTADMIGLGPNPGIGWKQILLIIAGAAVVGGGFVLGGKPNAPDE